MHSMLRSLPRVSCKVRPCMDTVVGVWEREDIGLVMQSVETDAVGLSATSAIQLPSMNGTVWNSGLAYLHVI